MEHDMKAVIQRELTANEHILWSGKPKQGIIIFPRHFVTLTFSVLLFGVGMYLTVHLLQLGAPVYYILFSALLIFLSGLYLLGVFVLDVVKRSKKTYVLTNQRVFVFTGEDTVRFHDLDKVGTISILEQAGNCGTIVFGPVDTKRSLRFEMIEYVNQMLDTAKNAQGAAR